MSGATETGRTNAGSRLRARMAALAAGLAIALVVAPSASATSSQGGQEVARGAGIQKAERQIRACANRERREAGLPRLAASPVLGRAARAHARDMAKRGYFDHDSPDGKGVGDRVREAGPKARFSYLGENIAAGYADPAATCEGWMKSSGHRQNILNRNYTEIGGGFATGGPYGVYYVQVFAREG